MDEQEQDARVTALFRDAAADAPPPGFDTRDVVAASRRITRRRRSAVAGAALAVLAVAGIGVTAGLSGGGGTDMTTASAAGAPHPAAQDQAAQDQAAQDQAAKDPAAPGGAAPDAAVPGAARAAAPEAAAPPPVASGEGASAAGPQRSDATGPAPAPAPGAGAPLGPGTRECADRQDPALRALLEQALPEVAGAPEAVTTMECRPGRERGLALEVHEGATAGVLTVTYLPPGEVVDPPGIAEPPAAVVRSAPTASGGTVLVASRTERAGDPAPFTGRLDAVVAALAPRL
jgi:hypothetical protein